jgi:hypothetical protein
MRRRRQSLPTSFRALVEAGGPPGMVRRAMAVAAAQERRFWLGVLMSVQRRGGHDLDASEAALLAVYIRELRRQLHIRPAQKTVRAQTRERVRRYRERQRERVQAS